MDTFAIAVAGFGSGLPDGAVHATLGIGPSPAELFAGLGALALATLGVLIVRSLQSAPRDLPQAPAATPDPGHADLKRAA